MTQIVTENVVLETSHVFLVSMIPTSKASTLLQVFGGSSPERTGREVRLAWAPKIAPFGVARSIPDIRSCFKFWMLLCFAFHWRSKLLSAVANPIESGESQGALMHSSLL